MRSTCLIAVVLLLVGVASGQDNLIVNGNFDENDDGWALIDDSAANWMGAQGGGG